MPASVFSVSFPCMCFLLSSMDAMSLFGRLTRGINF